MNPSQNTQAQKSHISKMRCVCVHICIHHMLEGGKAVYEAQKTGVAQGHSLLEKRKGKIMTKRNRLGDRSQVTTSFCLPMCSHLLPWVS